LTTDSDVLQNMAMKEKTSLIIMLLGMGVMLLAGAAAAGNGQAEGKVIEVKGDRVRIALEKGGAARAGHQLEIYTADAELAGFWLVIEVREGEVTAVKVEALSTPQVGWKASVYDADAVAQAPATPLPWEKDEPEETNKSQSSSPPVDYGKIFGPPPPGAVVSSKGYLVKLPDGRFQEGFDNFKRRAADRGPSREQMVQAYKNWRDSPGENPFLGLWAEKNDYTLTQTYAMGPVGLVVLGVCPGAAAEKAGLRTGDIILKIGGEFVRDPLYLSEAAGPLQLEVERDSHTLDIILEAEQHE
jgi:hypothetical protein